MPQTTRNDQVMLGLQRREAQAALATVDGETRSFDIVFSAGAEVRRFDYWTGDDYIESLEVSEQAIRLDRLNSGRAPVLDSHGQWSLDSVLGVVEAGSARIAGSEALARIRLSQREEVAPVLADVRDGIIGNVSCGYITHRYREEVRDGVRYRIAEDWEPVEVSLVPIGADPDAVLRSAPRGAVYPCTIVRAAPAQQEAYMPQENPAPGAAPPLPNPASPPIPTVAARSAPPETPTDPAAPRAHAWSSDDISRINARALAFGLSAAEAITVMADANVRTVDAATDALQNRAAARQSQRNDPHLRVTQDEGDTLRRAVESAIMLRANPQAFAAAAPEREIARNWRGMSLLETGRLFIEESQGVRLRGLSRLELASACLGMQTLGGGVHARAVGMHSTSDFANLLANVASKRLRMAYEAAPQNWRRIGRQSNNPDFKEKSVVQLSSAPSFKEVREGAEYSYGGLTDGVEKYALATYGRIIAITRQTLINDDLGAFDRLPTMLGRQAAELEASVFWSVITSNPNLSDGVALFHATHGNLGAAGAISETTLTEAKKLMRQQKSLAAKAADREPLNLTPRFLIVSPDKEVEAQKMLTAVLAAATGNVNVFSNSMELIVEARLSGNAWYVSADPAMIDTIEYAYLEGEEGVFSEQRVGFEVDGIEVKARLDFAAKAIDYRGLFKNAG